MKYTIKSRVLKREITFSRPGFGNIYVDTNGKPDDMGDLVCYFGRTSGKTLIYRGEDQARFESICRGWYRAHRKVKSK